MKRRMLVASFALAVLGAMGLASPVVAGEFVPLQGTLEGIDQNLTPPPLVEIHGVGEGEATQLGRFTYDFQATVDLRNTPPNPPQGVGTLILTAANGDTLVAGVIGASRPIIPGELVEVTEQAIVIDGTGRFAGATGEFTLTRLVYQDTRFTIGSFEGVISAPGTGRP
jgi:hypothetical protein